MCHRGAATTPIADRAVQTSKTFGLVALRSSERPCPEVSPAVRNASNIGFSSLALATPNGPLPIQDNIPAKDLQQAIKKFPEVMQLAMEQLIEEVQKYQEQEQGRIQKTESGLIIPGR